MKMCLHLTWLSFKFLRDQFKRCRQLLALCLLGACLPANAGTVHVSASGFSPLLINVLTNEPVTWVADDAGPYTITVWSGVWAPIHLNGQGSTGSVTPIFSGTYDYGDDRGHSGMFYVNIPPVVRITNPTNNEVFTSPASFEFAVEAINYDEDKLLGVDLFLDTTYLDGSLNGLFSLPISNLRAGTYTLWAVAVDFSDGLATNSITIQVRDAVSLVVSPAGIVGRQLAIDVTGATSDKSIVLQSSTNLADAQGWISQQTNTAVAGATRFFPVISTGQLFFRAGQLP